MDAHVRAQFDRAEIASLGAPVQRFFTHAMAPGTTLYTAAAIQLHGAFRMAEDKPWFVLDARQRIAAFRGFVWQAKVRRRVLAFDGADYLIAGECAGLRIWLWAMLPVVHASGPDIQRSAVGRLASEMLWTPAALLPRFGVRWECAGNNVIVARFTIAGEDICLSLRCDAAGAVTALWLDRWRVDMPGREPGYAVFGADINAYTTCAGYTVPSRMEGGWDYNTAQYAPFVRYEVETFQPG
ncbi:MAG: DUF6544 family protein [Candidatus Hydrogenedentota bacterium]